MKTDAERIRCLVEQVVDARDKSASVTRDPLDDLEHVLPAALAELTSFREEVEALRERLGERDEEAEDLHKEVARLKAKLGADAEDDE